MSSFANFPYFYYDVKAFLAAKTLWEWEKIIGFVNWIFTIILYENIVVLYHNYVLTDLARRGRWKKFGSRADYIGVKLCRTIAKRIERKRSIYARFLL